jgi:cold shock protein
MQGKIMTVDRDRGFGFIRTAGGEEVFFHRTTLQQIDFDRLRKGDAVELAMVRSQNGLRAVRVYRARLQSS